MQLNNEKKFTKKFSYKKYMKYFYYIYRFFSCEKIIF